jgi:cadmium resistance protein CadD (predicted permease)
VARTCARRPTACVTAPPRARDRRCAAARRTSVFAARPTSAIIVRAAGLFAATNIDDLLLLALFFGRGAGQPRSTTRIVIGQYLGLAGILILSIAASFSASLLPPSVIPYFGLVPLGLGLQSAWSAIGANDGATDGSVAVREGPTIIGMAAITLANGGDNIGVYVPVFTTTSAARIGAYVLVFFALLAVWICAGRLVATRPPVARALSRWAHILLPVVLIIIGLLILVKGNAFGL